MPRTLSVGTLFLSQGRTKQAPRLKRRMGEGDNTEKDSLHQKGLLLLPETPSHFSRMHLSSARREREKKTQLKTKGTSEKVRFRASGNSQGPSFVFLFCFSRCAVINATSRSAQTKNKSRYSNYFNKYSLKYELQQVYSCSLLG